MKSERRVAFAVAPISRLDAERMAERFLEAMYPGNLVTPTRLDVPEFMDRLEAVCGVVFGVQDLDPGVEGLTDPVNHEILVDTQVFQAALHGDGRSRQTCVHEAGHIPHISQVREVIRHGAPQLARRLNVTVPAYRDPEWQAHAVGAALLMPRTTFPAVYREGGEHAIAEFFGVSLRSAFVRADVLRGLGIQL